MQHDALRDVWNAGKDHWWYRVRRSLVHDLLRTVAPRGARLLDVGCATGDTMAFLSREYCVEGVEVSKEAVAAAVARGLSVTAGTLPTLPYESNRFDVVTILDVLEHIDDDGRMLQEIERVLKPGGVCIIFVPAFMFLWSVTDVRSEHRRRYTTQTLAAVLERTHLRTERRSYFNTFLFPAIAFVRLLNRVRILRDSSEMEGGYSKFNSILHAVFNAERYVLPYASFPFGVSLFAVVRKYDSVH